MLFIKLTKLEKTTRELCLHGVRRGKLICMVVKMLSLTYLMDIQVDKSSRTVGYGLAFRGDTLVQKLFWESTSCINYDKKFSGVKGKFREQC